jgi:hypothetical protein
MGVVKVIENSAFDKVACSQRKSHISHENGEHPAKWGHRLNKQPEDRLAEGPRSTQIERCAARRKYRQTAKRTVREIYLDKPEAYELLLVHRILADQIEAGAYHKLHSARRRLKSMVKQRGGDPNKLFIEYFGPETDPINRELYVMKLWAPLLGSAINGCPQNLYLFMRGPGDLGDQIRAVSPFTGIALLTKQCRALNLSANAGALHALLTE